MVVDPQTRPRSPSGSEPARRGPPVGGQVHTCTPEGLCEALCEALRGRHRDASLAVDTCAGEPDIRVRVLGGGQTAVELLGPGAEGVLIGDRWHAVRITPEDRAVWRGPSRSCPLEVLAGFVEDLLDSPVGATGHARAYERLG